MDASAKPNRPLVINSASLDNSCSYCSLRIALIGWSRLSFVSILVAKLATNLSPQLEAPALRKETYS